METRAPLRPTLMDGPLLLTVSLTPLPSFFDFLNDHHIVSSSFAMGRGTAPLRPRYSHSLLAPDPIPVPIEAVRVGLAYREPLPTADLRVIAVEVGRRGRDAEIWVGRATVTGLGLSGGFRCCCRHSRLGRHSSRGGNGCIGRRRTFSGRWLRRGLRTGRVRRPRLGCGFRDWSIGGRTGGGGRTFGDRGRCGAFRGCCHGRARLGWRGLAGCQEQRQSHGGCAHGLPGIQTDPGNLPATLSSMR